MATLKPARLHICFLEGALPNAPLHPRKYTLTHSDRTGHLYLTIGTEYAWKQVQGLYTRFMRDQVLATWETADDGMELHVYCHVSGRGAFGSAKWRNRILIKEMPLALESFRYGDAQVVKQHPELDEAPIYVHFQSNRAKYNRVEEYGNFGDYQIKS